jgi:hypothetical protein
MWPAGKSAPNVRITTPVWSEEIYTAEAEMYANNPMRIDTRPALVSDARAAVEAEAALKTSKIIPPKIRSEPKISAVIV